MLYTSHPLRTITVRNAALLKCYNVLRTLVVSSISFLCPVAKDANEWRAKLILQPIGITSAVGRLEPRDMVARDRRGSPTRAAISCHARTGIHSCCIGSVSRLDLDHHELPIQLCPIHSSVGIAMIVVRYSILV